MKASTASLILALSAASPSVAIPPVPPVAATSTTDTATSTTDTATATYTSLGAMPGDGSTPGFSSAAKSSIDMSSIPPTPDMPKPTHSHLMANQSTVITLSEHYRTVVVSIGVENTTARHMHEKERLRNELDGDGDGLETGFADRDPARTETEDYVLPNTETVHPHGYYENKDGHHFKDLETLRGRLKMAIRLALDPKRLRDMLRFERERRRDRKLDGGPWGNQTFGGNKGRLLPEEGTLPMWNATTAHAPGPVVGPAMNKDY